MVEDAKPVSFVDRVAAQAANVRPAKVLLTLLALPFYALGLIVGALLVVARFAYAAVVVGVADVTARQSGKGGG